jgi:pimeloyl-ACP methyl ester carboxylesterase
LWRASIVQDVPTGDDVQTVEVRRADGGVVALEMAGDRGGAPLLVCHGLADSRLSAQLLAQTADELGFCVVAPDRPGVGLTDPRRLERLADWVEDAALVLGALRLESVACWESPAAALLRRPARQRFRAASVGCCSCRRSG